MPWRSSTSDYSRSRPEYSVGFCDAARCTVNRRLEAWLGTSTMVYAAAAAHGAASHLSEVARIPIREDDGMEWRTEFLQLRRHAHGIDDANFTVFPKLTRIWFSVFGGMLACISVNLLSPCTTVDFYVLLIVFTGEPHAATVNFNLHSHDHCRRVY